jgi:hypothetical protein
MLCVALPSSQSILCSLPNRNTAADVYTTLQLFGKAGSRFLRCQCAANVDVISITLLSIAGFV